MYAIVRIAGSQYLVREGLTITVPRLAAEKGTTIRLDDILFLRTADNTLLGQPRVAGGMVEAEVVDHPRADKITVFKFRRRENYRRKIGHRQQLTRIRVSSIRHES